MTFTPADTTDYTTATDFVSITVNKATPTITWAAPAAITYGTALSAAVECNGVSGRHDGVQPGSGDGAQRWCQPGIAGDFHADGHDGLHDGDGHGSHHRQ